MRVTVVMTDEIFARIAGALEDPVETAGVLIAGIASSEDELTLLVRTAHWIPEESYERRERQRLVIRSSGYVPALKRAADDDAVAIFFHTHPGGQPRPSDLDIAVDEQLHDVFHFRTGKPYVSLIVGSSSGSPTFTGRAFLDHVVPISRLRVVGARIRLLSAYGSTDGLTDEQPFDRQTRVFGHVGQALLHSLHVGVVGAGGTGSTVCEQLIRLGVGRITVLDDDAVTLSNLTRIHEAHKSHVGSLKVDVVASSASKIGLGADVTSVGSRSTDLIAALRLRHCDVVFGCTDDNRGRAVLSRLAYWYLVPVFDMGVLVDTDGVHVRGLFGRVSTLYPGVGCLICRGRIDARLLAAEALHPDERQRLAGEGYVPGLGEPDPSVGTYTTLVAAVAVNELLARLFGYGPDPFPPEVVLRLHDRYISLQAAVPRPEHYCADRRVWGRGDQEPFLDQLWAESSGS